jgi:hypothetical protein
LVRPSGRRASSNRRARTRAAFDISRLC